VASIRLATALAGLLLTACAGLWGDDGSAGPLAGPTVTPSPTVTGAPDGGIAFVLDDMYGFMDKIDVRIMNTGDRAYEYNSTGYEACNLTYRDETGREFIIPPGTHCDLVAIEQIEPGETVTLFEWHLDECVKDNWGCVKSESLKPGTYTIEGTFRAAGGGLPAHAEATFEIVPVE
jgi:hypothetical protein